MALTLHVPQNPKPLPPGFQTLRSLIEGSHKQNYVNSLHALYLGSAIKNEDHPELNNWVYLHSPFPMGVEGTEEPDLAVEIAVGGEYCPREDLFAGLIHESKPDVKRSTKKRGNPIAKPPTKMIDLRSARHAAVNQIKDRMSDGRHWDTLRGHRWNDLIGSVGLGEHFFVCVRKTDSELLYRVSQGAEEAQFQEHPITPVPGHGYEYPQEQFTSIDHPFFQNVYSAAGEHILQQVMEKQQDLYFG